MQVLNGYGRVSREGDRKGTEGFHAPEEYEQMIRRKIEAEKAEVGRIVIETNVSGGKAAKARGLEALIVDIENGNAQGLVVPNWKRFSREHPLDALEYLNRLRKTGGYLLTCDEGLDTRNEGSLSFAMGLAEASHAERKSMIERSNFSREDAVGRGVHPSRTPFGYTRNESKKLVPDPETAPLVLELFERRACGSSVSELERFLADSGHKFARSSTRAMLANETYLGHVKVGIHEHLNAHKPLIGVELWNQVQATKGKRPVHSGALASQVMLRSLLRCASCGTSMCVTWTNGPKDDDGTRIKVAAYSCNNRVGCASKSYIRADELDAFIDGWVIHDLEERESSAQAFQAEQRLNAVAAELAEVEADYERLKKSAAKLIASVGEDDFAEMSGIAKGKVELLRVEHGRALNESQSIDGFNGSMRETWPILNLEAKRSILIDWFDYIRVEALNGRRNVPTEDRVSIVIDGALVEGVTSLVAAA
jgi:DNA invertase Pin-like site-specific DNA recombinase